MPLVPPSWTPAGLAARLRSLWRAAFRRDDFESEMEEEFRHHVELRTEDLVRREGLTRKEAYRRARLEFGHVEAHREEARASRGLRWFDELTFSWLDVKLGLRMLAKYPGLSVVSVLGMAVAIAIGAGAFAFLGALLETDLPLHEGDRIVAIQNNTDNPGNPDRQALHDFLVWRADLVTVRDVSAFTADRRNLIAPDGEVALVGVAEMTASGFRVARVPPLMGRHLIEGDEAPGAPPVLVIGHGEWQRRFDADPAIVGRVVRLGSTAHTVVGVMPEGFRFPVSHRYWTPLRLDPSAHPFGGGPPINVFARLGDGESMSSAQAELATIGARMAAEYPDTHARLRPTVLPYTYPFSDIDTPLMEWLLRGFRLMVGLLLVVVAVNVSVLVYARTATRMGEIAVRSALGASRRRVVTQLFAEALVLALLSAGIGLAIAGFGLAKASEIIRGSITGNEFPFWIELGISAEVALYVVGLAVLAGVIVGVLPGLKATGRSLQAGLKTIGAGGSRMQLGRTWTAMIVVQVAIAVAVLPFAMFATGGFVDQATSEPGYPADEFLRAYLSVERVEVPPASEAEAYERMIRSRYLASAGELFNRLEAEPAVAGATFAGAFPGEEWVRRIEVERGESVRWVRVNDAAPNLPALFGLPILAGREFTAADTLEASRTVIVDRVFAERMLGDGAAAGAGSAVGRRVREVARGRRPEGTDVPGPWLEVVGVADVPDFNVNSDPGDETPRLYRPVGLGDLTSVVTVAIRTRGTRPGAFMGRLREVAAAVDPGLQLHELRVAADVERTNRQSLLFLALGIGAVTLSVLLLSAAGIYAMMSFTVARRRREIGIRSALGANPHRVLGSIFARAARQLAAGILAGLFLATGIARLAGTNLLTGRGPALLLAVVALMAAIGLLAALGPARRGLAVPPTEALREE